MLKCEFDDPIERKELLKALLMSKMDQVELAILDGDFHDVIEILDDAYHICVNAGEMEMATAFFEQEKHFKDKLENKLDELNKRAATKAWLKAMLQLSMKKNMARLQKCKQLIME